MAKLSKEQKKILKDVSLQLKTIPIKDRVKLLNPKGVQKLIAEAKEHVKDE